MTTKNVTMGDGAWFLFKQGAGMLALLTCVAVAVALLPTLLVLK
jgi:hypothetical protein